MRRSSTSAAVLILALAALGGGPSSGSATVRLRAAVRDRVALSAYCRERRSVLRAGSDFYGISETPLTAADPTFINCTAGQYAAHGLAIYRGPLDWAAVERSPHRFNWGYYDRLVYTLATHGVGYLPELVDPPPFRARHLRGRSVSGVQPVPRHAGQYGAFAALAARRYGPRGTFWRSNRALRYLPVRSWQIWNEPDLPVYWWPKPDPAAYTRLLHAAFLSIRQVDPGAEIVTAGMPYTSTRGVPFSSFFSAMLRNGAQGSFTTVALHPYAATAAVSFQRIKLVRQLMTRSGLARVPLWITEYGWSSSGPPSIYRAGSPRAQADRIAGLLSLLSNQRQALGLRGIIYADWTDERVRDPRTDYWGLHLGLLDAGLRPKPALAVVVAAERVR